MSKKKKKKLVILYLECFCLYNSSQALLEMVVKKSEGYSVEQLERLYSLLSQCIYQYRREYDKTQLLEVSKRDILWVSLSKVRLIVWTLVSQKVWTEYLNQYSNLQMIYNSKIKYNAVCQIVDYILKLIHWLVDQQN